LTKPASKGGWPGESPVLAQRTASAAGEGSLVILLLAERAR
jgi:hypothetical protein